MAERNYAQPKCACGSVSKDGECNCSEFCAGSEHASLEDCQCDHPECLTTLAPGEASE